MKTKNKIVKGKTPYHLNLLIEDMEDGTCLLKVKGIPNLEVRSDTRKDAISILHNAINLSLNCSKKLINKLKKGNLNLNEIFFLYVSTNVKEIRKNLKYVMTIKDNIKGFLNESAKLLKCLKKQKQVSDKDTRLIIEEEIKKINKLRESYQCNKSKVPV